MQREAAAHEGGAHGRGDEGACWFWSLGKCTKGRKCKFAHMGAVVAPLGCPRPKTTARPRTVASSRLSCRRGRQTGDSQPLLLTVGSQLGHLRDAAPATATREPRGDSESIEWTLVLKNTFLSVVPRVSRSRALRPVQSAPDLRFQAH
ncbi:unnamed protein product [Prorocentrum cordatum]|uniref:C3H1-type domain-containing protein n=1 Tax=Prorocentrum cordatum TaxID=2364126 RepID=A0ABN9XED4_9DINO|nr:unnamed protein product [Polarella glacialis]